MQKLSIYIHIPFCIKKCLYCDFLSFPAGEEARERYVRALLKEIESEAGKYAAYTVDTVFIGGGTPSLLSAGQLDRIMNRLHALFSFTGEQEITLEANPGTVTPEKLADFRRAGISRLSIGTQSVHDRELALLGRIHTAADFFGTFRWAREAGFSNINVDLMAALPGQSAADYRDTLVRVAELAPEHISAYSLIIEEGTYFHELYGDGHTADGAAGLPSEEEERAMDEQTQTILADRGYRRYEISNYARPGWECRHNTAYWTRRDYVGFGIGAASMVNNVRWKNRTDMEEYIRFLEEGGGTVREEEQILSIPEQMEEFMFLGLRLTEGVGKHDFLDAFGKPMESVYGEVTAKLSGQGLLVDGSRVKLTPYGRDVSNYVMAEFLF